MMNWLDVGVLVFVVSSGVSGLVRGLLRELAGMLGLMLGLYVALRYHQALAVAVDAHRGDTPWARILAFMAIVVACWIAGELAGVLAGKTIDLTGARWLDRIVGAIFGAARGFIVAGIMLLLVNRYLGDSRFPVDSSTLGRPAVSAARAIGERIWTELRTPERDAARRVAGGLHGKDSST